MRWMRISASAAIAAAAVGVMGSAAQATVSGITLVRVPYTAAAKTADPTHLGDGAFPRTFDLQIHQVGGEHWTYATLQTALTAGGFYNPAVGDSDYQPSAAAIGAVANLQFDTYLTTPDGGAGTVGGANIAVPGQSDYIPSGGGAQGKALFPGTGHDSNFDPSNSPTINVTWGALNPWNTNGATTPDGTYTVAQITVLGKSAGTISAGHVGGSGATTDAAYAAVSIPKNGDFNGDTLANNGDITAFINDLSDPTSLHNPAILAIGDFNNDGLFNNGDITGFINYLSAVGAPGVAGKRSCLSWRPWCLSPHRCLCLDWRWCR